MTIVLATQNLHKKRELSEILSDHVLTMPGDEGIAFDFEETGSSFIENAFGKAFHLHDLAGKPVLADDSGLCVPALDGEPGVLSARYGSTETHGKLSDFERNEHLLKNMRDLTDRRAFFVCCMVLLINENRFYIAQETVDGEITLSPQGAGGFGYDPLFFLPAYGMTIAQLPGVQKNKISHRGKSARKIATLIAESH